MKAVILGGTGTLGRALARKLLEDPTHDVTIFSRCELKQKETEIDLGARPQLRFVLGDVRDFASVSRALCGADTVFHVAALKHIDSMELNPEESVKTNVLGTINVAEAAIQNHIKHVLFSSTDKAVDPISVYGFSKALSEKILLRRNETQSTTKFHVYRWGNVLGSRGSALQGFAKSLLGKGEVSITDFKMSRFWIRIEDAVDFMLSTYIEDLGREAMVPPIKAAPVTRIIESVARVVGADPEFKWKHIGIRRCEKTHEMLRSCHEANPLGSDFADQYEDHELDTLVKEALQ